MSDSHVQDIPAPSADRAARKSGGGTVSSFKPRLSLLTGCQDKPYALGLAKALAEQEITLDFIGSDQINGPEVQNNPRVQFLNLRGDQRRDAGWLRKVSRIVSYYFRLIAYASSAKPRVFHILWSNKFELFDRTLLQLYYKLLGKKIVFTAHNVNAGKRDSNDSFLNRVSLRIGYSLCDHIFVHTRGMKTELCRDFQVPEDRVTVIPFGMNATVPTTAITSAAAKAIMGVEEKKTLLFFGNIAPYKGLEFLIQALAELVSQDDSYRLLVVGPVKGCQDYWAAMQQMMRATAVERCIIQRIEFVPDEQVELFFKAADVLILPYTHIFQSGVLSLGYNFGLPVIAADVGSLREDIVESETGFVCQPRNPHDLALTIKKYFSSDLFKELPARRQEIREFAEERFSWATVGKMTRAVYSKLLPDGEEA